MAGKSCNTNLLEFLEKVTEAADKGKSVDIVYLNFAKVLDKVPTERLLKKLTAHGVGGKIKNWIASWLKDRKQRVTVDGKKSGWQKVLSGVPQGSVLGPVLFLIFINDLDNAATENQVVRKFADDTKVSQVIEGPDDAEELQGTLDRLCQWATDWGMAFNVAKCHVMHVGQNNPRHKYHMQGEALKTTEEERDIGVTVTVNLKPSRQCQKAAQTAHTVLAQILRAFHYRDRHVYISLYKQYVRPHLEFAVAAWSPWTKADIECLEKVQMKAARAVSGLRGRSYEERTAELKLPSLQERRRQADMAQTYKIMASEDSDQWITRADTRRTTRNTCGLNNIVPMRNNHEYRNNFFSQRVVEEWNSLPDVVKESRTVQMFKRRYWRHTEGTLAPA